MSKRSLPLVNAARAEFGFLRTHCACDECTRNCHHIPGYLVPADLERMHCYLAGDQDLSCWARQYLLASPGALVVCRGHTVRIPTLVPARRPDGACLFLTATDECAIHAISPFGCAFFDAHVAEAEADRRSKRGLQAVLEAWNGSGLYARTWLALAGKGLVAPTPEFARHQLWQASDDDRPR